MTNFVGSGTFSGVGNFTNFTGNGNFTGAANGTFSGDGTQLNLGAINSFTPTIGDGTHSFTPINAKGFYTKSGNLIYVEIWITWSSKAG